MSNILTDKFKNNSSKWLFAAILLVSFFTFSGIVLKPQATLNVQRTTLVVNPQTSQPKIISYKRALLQAYSDFSALSIFTISTFDISRIHSSQVCTCINSLLMSYKCRPKTAFFFPVKIFPQNAGDYPVIHLG
jgi:hypothetical protein